MIEEHAYLMAGGPMPKNELIEQFSEALAECDAEKPKVAFIGTASKDNKPFYMMYKALFKSAGAGELKRLRLCSDKADTEEAKEYLRECDAVFLAGGDAGEGIYWLEKRGIKDLLIQLYHGGKLFIAISGGVTMMGDKWVRRVKPEKAAAADLFDCLGLIGGVYDTNEEGEEWSALLSVLKLMGKESIGRGIKGGGVVRVTGGEGGQSFSGGVLTFTAGEGTNTTTD